MQFSNSGLVPLAGTMIILIHPSCSRLSRLLLWCLHVSYKAHHWCKVTFGHHAEFAYEGQIMLETATEVRLSLELLYCVPMVYVCMCIHPHHSREQLLHDLHEVLWNSVELLIWHNFPGRQDIIRELCQQFHILRSTDTSW